MNIEEFKQWWNRFEYSGNFPEPKAEHINLLLAEITRLTAELEEAKAYREVIDDALVVASIGLPSGDAKADLHKLLMWEFNAALDPRVSKRAVDLLAEKEEEIDWWKPLATKLADDVHCLKEDIAKLSNLAASCLADQEAIEKRMAEEIIAIAKDWLEKPCRDYTEAVSCATKKCEDCFEKAIRKKYEIKEETC